MHSCFLYHAINAGLDMAIVNSGKAEKIFLVGFDGYNSDDERNNEMNSFLSLYSTLNLITVTSLTPSKYSLDSA